MEGWGVSPHLVAGYFAGSLAAIVCAPLDTIGNRLRVERYCEKRIQETSLLRIAQHTVRDEGLPGLYRGLSVTLMALPVSQATYFYAYAESRRLLRQLDLGENLVNALGAGIGACCNNLISNPLWLARTRIMAQQLHASTRYTHVIQTIRLIAREEGCAALYQGVSASLLGVVHVMVQFPLYEALKQLRSSPDPPSYLEMIYIAVVPKLIASSVSYPHEVLRARLQDLNKTTQNIKFRGLMELITLTWRQEGMQGFYSGFKANLVRMVPGTYITLTAYEKVLDYIRSD